ncbi:hypothetical protein B0H13DRAFT_1855361 [Mycena leptocephala]|nr:hypothetical protein B0H13DRAFT_1855361 [Mycena leptocephala]
MAIPSDKWVLLALLPLTLTRFPQDRFRARGRHFPLFFDLPTYCFPGNSAQTNEPLKSDLLDVPAGEGSAPSSQTGKSSLAEKSVYEKAADQLHLLAYTSDRLLHFLTLVVHSEELFGDERAELDDKMDPFLNVAGSLLPYKDALRKKASNIIGPLLHHQSQLFPTTSTLTQHHRTIIKRQISSAGAKILQ